MHSAIFPTVKVAPPAYDLHSYLEWRDNQDGPPLLQQSGLTIGEAVQWHRTLSVDAQMCDPLDDFRNLLRHADRGKRDRLKGDALRAHTLYDIAEVLRRYVEEFHGQTLPDEADVGQARADVVNRENYGSDRPGDYQRSVFRRIAREFSVDPGYRLICYVEGETEDAFIRRWFDLVGANPDYEGVRIENLRGKDNVAVPIFEDQLVRLQSEEVLVVVCVDRDQLGGQGAAHRIWISSTTFEHET